MKVYSFSVTVLAPKRQKYKTVQVDSILLQCGRVIADEDIVEENISCDESIFYQAERIKVRVSTYDHKDKRKPLLPDFLDIIFFGTAISRKAKEFLLSQGVKFDSKPIELLDEPESNYEIVLFPKVDLTDLEASRAEWKGKKIVTKGKNYFDPSTLVLLSEAVTLDGIVSLSGHGLVLICSEQIMKNLRLSALTGVMFSEIAISTRS